jgi:hypothetical protein
VFLAEVVAVETEGQIRTVTLKVDRWWKGGGSAEITVSTSKNGESCGYPFEKGKQYLVYADREEKQKTLRVHLCSRTRTEKEAEKTEDFKELGEGKAPAVSPLIPAARTPADEPKPTIPVRVRVTAPKEPVKAGQPIPLTLTVENGLAGPIEFHSYATEPNDWNGETVAVDLVDVYRRRRSPA